LNKPVDSKIGAVTAPEAQHQAPLGLRTVAIFEMAKGLLVMIAGLGLLSLVHRDAQQVAEDIVKLLHLNPARHYPTIFIDFAARLNDSRLWFLSAAALVYSTVRFVETYGLWHERPWAEWFAVISASIYLPVEVWDMVHRFERHPVDHRTIISFVVFLTNTAIVIYLIYILYHTVKHPTQEQPVTR
jgi:uncharacterized membrane protein (DUF2068 family)